MNFFVGLYGSEANQIAQIMINGFNKHYRLFRATCRDYRLCRESIRPCTPEQSDMTKALLPTASGSMTSPRTSRRGPRSPNRLAGTTSVVLIRHSAT